MIFAPSYCESCPPVEEIEVIFFGGKGDIETIRLGQVLLTFETDNRKCIRRQTGNT